MTGAQRGFLLLASHLGDPARKPLTTPQLRKLAQRVRGAANPTELRDLTPEDLTALGYGPGEAAHIVGLLEEEFRLEHYLRKAEKAGCVPLTWLSPDYPGLLRQRLGDDAPACLWAKGDLSLLRRPMIGLVGSRDLSSENRRFARAAGIQAARQGYAIVSGNARGADRTAQDACLEAGGRVISIVADRLADHIPVPGVLYLSEEDFDLDFSPQRALSRNRVIHSLGCCTLVAQCGFRSGGTWDGSVKNLRFGWSGLLVFDDGSPAAAELAQMGGEGISIDQLSDLSKLSESVISPMFM